MYPICFPPLDSTIAVPLAVACRGAGCLLLWEHPAVSSVIAQTAMSTRFHFFIASCAPPDLSDIRNAVNERASSSVMCWLGSMVPGRSACGSFSQ